MANERPGFISQDAIRNRVYNPGKCVGFVQQTIDGSVQFLDFSVCTQQPRYAIMSLESDATGTAIRYMITGEPATSAAGMPKTDGSVWDIISTEDLVRFQVTQAQAGTHTLNVEFYV